MRYQKHDWYFTNTEQTPVLGQALGKASPPVKAGLTKENIGFRPTMIPEESRPAQPENLAAEILEEKVPSPSCV